MDIAGSESLNFTTGGFSVGGWVRIPSTATSQSGGIIGKMYCPNDSRGYFLGVNGKSFTFRVGGVNATGTATANDDMWHLVIGTFDGTGVHLYVDGDVVSNAPGDYAAGGTTSKVVLLNRGDSASCFGYDLNGNLDEAWIWSYALSSTEVLDLWSSAQADAGAD